MFLFNCFTVRNNFCNLFLTEETMAFIINQRNFNMAKVKEFFAKNPAAWEFAKYSIFSYISGMTELIVFTILNYFLPHNGINKAIHWFIFDYPTAAGGLGAFIAFVVSSVIGQGLKFITNFTKTFKSTNNMFLSAIAFAIVAVLIVVGLNLCIGGLLNTALCKVIPNADIAGIIAKAIAQVAGFLLAFPVNKYVIMRKKKETPDEE